jgi:hypothetical protein
MTAGAGIASKRILSAVREFLRNRRAAAIHRRDFSERMQRRR